MSDDLSAQRRRVVWDEHNLNHNKAYFEANPVKKHIDEPKTPYEPDKAMDEEGNFVNSEDEAEKRSKNPRMHDWVPASAALSLAAAEEAEARRKAAAASNNQSQNGEEYDDESACWDEETKSFARRARVAAPVVSVVSAEGSSSAAVYGSSAQIDSHSSPDQSEFKRLRSQQQADLSASASASASLNASGSGRRFSGGGGRSLALSLGDAPSEAELKEREQKQHEMEFKYMRKAVYADEGAKFREQLRLAKLKAAADEEDDGDDEAN